MLLVRVDGLDQVDQALESIQKAFDPEDILDEASAIMLARVRQRFLAELDEDGVPWRPSFASILREKRGRGGGTLFDTGWLFHSIQEFRTSDGREIGTDVPYASKHNFGLDGMVRRRFMGVNNDDVQTMQDSIYARVSQKLGASNG